MRPFRIGFNAALLVAVAARCAFAGDGGSAYSLIGIGDLRYIPNARSAAMGYAGLALMSPTSINMFSPGSWSSLHYTRLQADALYEGFNSTDGINSRYLARVDFSGAALSVPIADSEGIVFVAGITPFSRINYDTYDAGLFPGAVETLRYSTHYTGSGGVARAFMGASYVPVDGLSLGFSMNYLFGSRDNSREIITHDTGFVGGLVSESNSVSGLTFTVGGVYSGFGAIAPWLRPLSFGFFVSSRGRIGTRSQSIYQFAPSESSTELDTITLVTGDLVVPVTYGFGIGYLAGDRYVIAADYIAEPWQSTEFNGGSIPNIRNSYRIGAGVEHTPSREPAASWLERFDTRLGAYYHSTYIQINGIGITEYGATAGFGFPVSLDTRMNIALEYAIRGSRQSGLIRDHIWRCTMSFNIGELWFQRYEEE